MLEMGAGSERGRSLAHRGRPMEPEDGRAPIMAAYWLGAGLLVVAATRAGLSWPALVAEALALLGR